ncbi:translation initiation factor if-3 [Babesia ovis]|uniref:Translation initiation factor if-3 n=1 Tax=Babesia ovis TaxID=5869 RepID=A0A9W5WUL2_BABOV|nr:translation initiation factor if-3 [Babesia ovis]
MYRVLTSLHNLARCSTGRPIRLFHCHGSIHLWNHRQFSSAKLEFPVDAEIRDPRVRVLRGGKFVGDFALQEALDLAKDEGVNLILFRPRATPPVCVLARYSEFIEQQKAARERAPTQATVDNSHQGTAPFVFDPSLKVKVVQISAQCGENDFVRKIQSARKFLESGHRVELVVFSKSNRRGVPQQPAPTVPVDKVVPLSFSLDNPLIQRVDYIYAQLADVGRPFTVRSKVDLKQRQLLLKFWPV